MHKISENSNNKKDQGDYYKGFGIFEIKFKLLVIYEIYW